MNSIPEAYRQRYETVAGMIIPFCQKHLNADYENLCIHALQKLCRKRNEPMSTGRDNMWAAGIVYAICQNCCVVGNDRYALLSRPKFRLSAEDISTAFGVSKGGMSERAKFIREELGITRNKAEWLAPELQEGAKVLAQFDRIMKGMR